MKKLKVVKSLQVMNINFSLQNSTDKYPFPEKRLFLKWIKTTLYDVPGNAEITLSLVDKETMQKLNHRYCGKRKPTNVLSFCYDFANQHLMGDIFLCLPIITEEAKNQNKPIEAHFAHLTVHAVLHLIGYDHDEPNAAESMEAKEISILSLLNYPNPYQEEKNDNGQ